MIFFIFFFHFSFYKKIFFFARRIFFEVNKHLSSEIECEIYSKCVEISEAAILKPFKHKFNFYFFDLGENEIEICLKRIKERNRQSEDLITDKYLHELSKRHGDLSKFLKPNYKTFAIKL